MNEKLQVFFDARQKEYEKEKNDILVELGLYEKVYSDSDEEYEHTDGIVFSEWDDEKGKSRLYKKKGIDISDEEFEKVKKYSKSALSSQSNNGVASIWKTIATFTYVVGFFIGLYLGVSGARYSGFFWGTAFITWAVAFFSGTIMLGFAEIIQLLHDIKNK